LKWFWKEAWSATNFGKRRTHLKRSIARSHRRNGRWEFPAFLLRRGSTLKRYPPFGHHPVTDAKLSEIPPDFTELNNQSTCPTHPANLQFPAIRFISPPLPLLIEQSDLHSGSEEVRSSILLGSIKFLDIFCMLLNGLCGICLPLLGPVPLCEAVLGFNRVTKYG